jgi:prolyl-tRNA synthetase
MSEQEGLTVKKSDFSEWYTQIVQKADLADIRYNVKGFIVYMPWATHTLELMYNHYETELRSKGHEKTIFPSVVPRSSFEKEAEHVKGFSAEVFWITEAGSQHKKFEEPLALRPTSETVMYPMYSLWIRSWRDLPLKLYQSCQIWRYEGKATRPFIRGREFHWIESHNVFRTKREAEAQVKEDMKIAEETIYKKFCVPFLFFKRPQFDKFPGSDYSYATDTILPNGKRLQIGTTHFLGQNFSKAFDITFEDKNGNKRYAYQTCYGPGISRMFAAVVSINGDDKGLVLPPLISPYEIVIVPIFKDKNMKKIVSHSEKLKSKLEKISLRVHIDSRSEYTPGFKYNHWELRGVPIRIEIGPRDIEKGTVVVVRRDTGKKTNVSEKILTKELEKTLDTIQKSLLAEADRYFNKQIHSASNSTELKKAINKGGFVKFDFCSFETDGAKCADEIKSKFNAEICGERYGDKSKPKGKCIVCGEKANVVAYAARSY